MNDINYVPTLHVHVSHSSSSDQQSYFLQQNQTRSTTPVQVNTKRPAPLTDLTNLPTTCLTLSTEAQEATPSKIPPDCGSPSRILKFLDGAEEEIKNIIETEKVNMAEAATQTWEDELLSTLTNANKIFTNEVLALREERDKLRKELESARHPANCLSGDDTRTKFLTGLPSYFIFVSLFNFLSLFVNATKTSLTLKDEFLPTLMKLRLNLKDQDLAYRFNVSKSSDNKIFTKWINVMHFRTKKFIIFPEEETVHKIIPPVFKKHFPNLCCIIDCTEIFIERPTNYLARALTYSRYKKHTTIKLLIGCLPNGIACFLSRCWGGRASDNKITFSTGFLGKLDVGNLVLADRRFTMEEDFAFKRLAVPPFTKGKKQLSKRDVEKSKQISNIRIHVERVISALKNHFLKGPLPVWFIMSKDGKSIATTDKVVTVCSVLTNLGDPILKYKKK